MVAQVLDVAAHELRPFDIIDEGFVIRSLTSFTRRWQIMEGGQVRAVCINIGGDQCVWGPEWLTLESRPVPQEPIRVMRGAEMPGYEVRCAECPLVPS